MSYPKVSAAEKYAEIGGRENAPKCECGKPKRWVAGAVYRAGGRWQYACRSAEWKEKNRKHIREYHREWRRKRVEAGLCKVCGKPVDGSGRIDCCLKHAIKAQLNQMDHRHRKAEARDLELLDSTQRETQVVGQVTKLRRTNGTLQL